MATDFGKIDHVDTLDADTGFGSLLDSEHFLASMSHELRTPLNAIIGFTGTLLMQLPGPLNEEQEKQLRMVQSSARQLLALVNDLLDLGKLGAGTLELHPAPLNCRSVVEELVQAFRPQARQKGLQRLRQVALNLVGNAIKFTERGEISITVERSVASGRQVVQFSVGDTGGGVPDDSVQQLGIRLSRKLAELLQGSIRRFDKPGNGSIFVLTLPLE